LREVTNDRHIAGYISQNPSANYKIFGSLVSQGKKIKTPEYIASSAHIRMVADRLTKVTGETWTPKQAQAAIWSYVLMNEGHGPGNIKETQIPSYSKALSEYQDALQNPF
jgi:hypothetical protein